MSHLSIVPTAEPDDKDPIFATIERHRRAAAIWAAAVHREFELEGKDDALYAEAQRVTEEQATEKGNACVDLVTTRRPPKALLLSYVITGRTRRSTAGLTGPITWATARKNTGRRWHAMRPPRLSGLRSWADHHQRATANRVRL
jgi:G:T/U-mismatch repair DNA glycosylase